MKYLSIVLILVSILLGAALVMTKSSDSAALDTATGTLSDFSNRLDTAQSKVTAGAKTILTLSNSLAETASAVLTGSNLLAAAQATNALQAEQLTGLNRQLTESLAAAQSLNASLQEATNQLAPLKAQISASQTNLTQATQDLVQLRHEYAQLQNRLQRDVAERLVVERKFSNPEALQAQMNKLQEYGGSFDVTADKIYAGLDVEVKADGVTHVIAPE